MDTAYEPLPLDGGGREAAGRPERQDRLRTGVGWLDSATGGFRARELVLLDGPGWYVSGLLSGICVDAAAGQGAGAVFVDGGNSIDPYGIARLSRLRGLEPGEVLSRIHVARAFTAHQMAALVIDGLEPALDRTGASAVVVSSLSGLFMDPDMGRSEALHLVRRAVGALRRAAEGRGVAVVVSETGGRGAHATGAIGRTLERAPDRIVRLRQTGCGMTASMPGLWPSARSQPAPCKEALPGGQAVLERFIREAGYGQDCRDL